MTVKCSSLPSGRPLYEGVVVQKRLGGKSRRNVLLCRPASTRDVRVVARILNRQIADHEQKKLQQTGGRPTSSGRGLDDEEDDGSERKMQDLEALGHLAAAAIADSPLLVLGTGLRTYIHLSQVTEIQDEQASQAPCSFSIVCEHKDYKFLATSSKDYKVWISALTTCFQQRSLATKVSPRVSTLPRNRSQSRNRPNAPYRTDTTDSIASSGVWGGGDQWGYEGSDRGSSSPAASRDAYFDAEDVHQVERGRSPANVRRQNTVIHRKRSVVRFAKETDDYEVDDRYDNRPASRSGLREQYDPYDEHEDEYRQSPEVSRFSTFTRAISSFLRPNSAEMQSDHGSLPRRGRRESSPNSRYEKSSKRSSSVSRFFSKPSTFDYPEDEENDRGRARSANRSDKQQRSASTDGNRRSRSRSLTRLFTLVPSVRLKPSQSLASLFNRSSSQNRNVPDQRPVAAYD
ncbi:hypothetical protein DFS34DRAFT_620143 [Phlyctochytrium arcticum]|nr:hypothetical protein DFS34DRAFT_620143 [Phlyctochytrium arcticum]